MDLEKTRAQMQREPTPEEAEKIKENVSVFENVSGFFSIKEGLKFIKNLRKEAKRQKAMKTAKQLTEQTKNIEHVPDIPVQTAERELADSFEIYEE